jgi:hypothetical protein
MLDDALAKAREDKSVKDESLQMIPSLLLKVRSMMTVWRHTTRQKSLRKIKGFADIKPADLKDGLPFVNIGNAFTIVTEEGIKRRFIDTVQYFTRARGKPIVTTSKGKRFDQGVSLQTCLVSVLKGAHDGSDEIYLPTHYLSARRFSSSQSKLYDEFARYLGMEKSGLPYNVQSHLMPGSEPSEEKMPLWALKRKKES